MSTSCPVCGGPKKAMFNLCYSCHADGRKGSTSCPECGRTKNPLFEFCFACTQRHESKAAFDEGYRSGLEAGRNEAGQQLTLDSTRLRQLIQLCHPDRHDGSRTATEATQWLLAQRSGVRT